MQALIYWFYLEGINEEGTSQQLISKGTKIILRLTTKTGKTERMHVRTITQSFTEHDAHAGAKVIENKHQEAVEKSVSETLAKGVERGNLLISARQKCFPGLIKKVKDIKILVREEE